LRLADIRARRNLHETAASLFIFLDRRREKERKKRGRKEEEKWGRYDDDASRDGRIIDDSPTTREQSSSVASRPSGGNPDVDAWNKINDSFLRSKGPDRAPHSQEEQIFQATQCH